MLVGSVVLIGGGFAFGKRGLSFIGVGSVALTLIILLISPPGYRQQCARSKCIRNLTRIAAALNAYHAQYGSYPPTYVTDENGTPVHSWRVLVLPQLGEHALYNAYRFDESWDGPHNNRLRYHMPDVFRCPWSQQGYASCRTSYVAIRGADTAWSGDLARRKADIWWDRVATILVMEDTSGTICWSEPRDLDFADVDKRLKGNRAPTLSGTHDGYIHAALCDGEVITISGRTSAERVR